MWLNLIFHLLTRWLCLKNGHGVKNWFHLLGCDNEEKGMIKRNWQTDWKTVEPYELKPVTGIWKNLNCLNHRDLPAPPFFIIKLYLRWSVWLHVLCKRTGSFPSSSSQFLMVWLLMEWKQVVASYSDVRESPV